MTSKTHMFNLTWISLVLLVLSTKVGAAPGDVLYERIAEGTSTEADAAAGEESFPPATFPHWIHRINYRCDACHDSLFEMKRGGTRVTMALMAEGKVCGACHNKVLAFGSDFQSCERCHVASDE